MSDNKYEPFCMSCSYKFKMDELERENKRLKHDIAHREYHAGIDRVKAENSDLKEAVDDLNKENNKLSADKMKLGVKNDELSQDKLLLEFDNGRLSIKVEEIKILSSDLDDYMTETGELHKQNKKIISDLDHYVSENKRLKHVIEGMSKLDSPLTFTVHGGIKAVREENDKLKQHISFLENENKKLTKRVAIECTYCDGNNKKIEEENDKLQKQNEALLKNLDSYFTQISDLKSELQRNERHCKTHCFFNEQKFKLQIENDNLKIENKTLKKTVDLLQNPPIFNVPKDYSNYTVPGTRFINMFGDESKLNRREKRIVKLTIKRLAEILAEKIK